MNKFIIPAAIIGSLLIPVTPGFAASCADLWYKRNRIYAENGYCFSTRLARRTFANFDCWTKNPKLSSYEKRRIASIIRQERNKGCKVN